MEENLQQVGSMVSNLRNMAVDMGNEIESQNKVLDKINRKVRYKHNKNNILHRITYTITYMYDLG